MQDPNAEVDVPYLVEVRGGDRALAMSWGSSRFCVLWEGWGDGLRTMQE